MHKTVLQGQSLIYPQSLLVMYVKCLYVNFQRYNLPTTAMTTLQAVLSKNEFNCI